jgi:hypothetical protein
MYNLLLHMLILFPPTKNYETTTARRTVLLLCKNFGCNCLVNSWCILFWQMHPDSIPANQIINETATTRTATLPAV